MFENEWFPQANAMGVSWQEFWSMNPHIIKCLIKGYEQKLLEQDYLQHIWWGNYGISALIFAVEHCLAGRNARTKYMKNSVFQEMEENKKPLSEEELQRQRELFVARLNVMKANFELNHKKKDNKIDSMAGE